MKSKLIFSLIFILTIIFLTSCGSREEEPILPQNASDMIRLADEAMSRLVSFDMKQNLSLEASIGEYAVTSNGEANASFIRTEGGLSFTFREDVEVYGSDNSVSGEKSYEKLSYQNGRLFYDNGYGKLTDECTEEDALELISDSKLFGLLIENCGKDELTPINNGYEASFGDYSKETLAELAVYFDLIGAGIEATLSDVSLKLSFTEDFYLSGFDFDIVTNGEGDSENGGAAIEFTGEIGNYNKASIAEGEFDSNGYTECEGLSSVIQMRKELNEYFYQKEGSFKTNVKITSKISSTVSSLVTKGAYSFGVNDGGFYYNVTTETGGVESNVSYRNGQCDTDGAVTAQSELVAMKLMRNSFSPFIYNLTYLYNASTGIDGRITAKYLLPSSVYGLKSDSGFATFSDIYGGAADVSATFLTKNGKLNQILYTVTVLTYHKSGGSQYTRETIFEGSIVIAK